MGGLYLMWLAQRAGKRARAIGVYACWGPFPLRFLGPLAPSCTQAKSFLALPSPACVTDPELHCDDLGALISTQTEIVGFTLHGAMFDD